MKMRKLGNIREFGKLNKIFQIFEKCVDSTPGLMYNVQACFGTPNEGDV